MRPEPVDTTRELAEELAAAKAEVERLRARIAAASELLMSSGTFLACEALRALRS